MKQVITIFILLITTQFTFAQSHTCCSAQDQFAALGNDPAFVMKHENPVPFTFISDKGEMISYPCDSGKDAHAFLIKANSPSDQYLFVFHEWWGLNDYIRQVSEQLFKDLEGRVNVIALDLFDGLVATDQKSAKSNMQQLNQARANSIIHGAIQYVGEKAKIATIGWCMGGGYSLQASLSAESQAIGCVMFYGFPEQDKERLQNLNADVLLIWANQDKWITKDVVDQFKVNMEAVSKKLIVQEYDADHAFANPSNAKFNEAAAKDAYAVALEFLKSRMQ